MKAVIRSANRNTTLSKESLEPAYNVEPVREKNKSFIFFFFFTDGLLSLRPSLSEPFYEVTSPKEAVTSA